jgi:hypothetical protein
MALSGPCNQGESLVEVVNDVKKRRLKCDARQPSQSVRAELSGPSSLCDRGFVFDESVKRCAETGATFGDSLDLEKYLDEHFFGK